MVTDPAVITRRIIIASRAFGDASSERRAGRLQNASEIAVSGIRALHSIPSRYTAPGTPGWVLLQNLIMLRDCTLSA